MRPDTSRPANDNVIPFTGTHRAGPPRPPEPECDAQLLIALLNTVSALESLTPYIHDAPMAVRSYAVASLTMAGAAFDRMGVNHAG